MGSTIAKINILRALGHYEYIIYILLSQRGPEYPGVHVQLGYPVDPLIAHDPLFRHEEDELQMSAEKKTKIVINRYDSPNIDQSISWRIKKNTYRSY